MSTPTRPIESERRDPVIRRERRSRRLASSLVEQEQLEPALAAYRQIVELAPGDAFGQRGYAALQRIHASGVVVRVTADTVILAPALIAEREHIDRICDTLGDALSAF